MIKERMTFHEYSEERLKAQGTAHPSQRDQLAVGALGLAGEVGEVIELIKKHLYHGKDLQAESLVKELGDVLWYVMYTADAVGVSLEDVAQTNNEKLRARYPNGFSVEAARTVPRG